MTFIFFKMVFQREGVGSRKVMSHTLSQWELELLGRVLWPHFDLVTSSR